jgi:hypothetical protein
MSRCLTLEQYLQEFVDENTQSPAEEVELLISDRQAQTLGFFFINGLAGFVEAVRLQRGTDSEVDEANEELNQSGFIN